SKKPVVMTGSMRSANETSADGPANLLNAVRVVVNKEAIGKGVLIVLNEDISAARDVWKTDNRRVHTFQSPSFGHLGVVDPDTVLFYRSPVRLHSFQCIFDVVNVDRLPNVEILTDFTGIDPSLVITFGNRKPDGLVVRTFAGGRMSAGMRAGLAAIAEKNIPTVITSRVLNGRIIGHPDYGFPAVVAHDLPDNKARILLILALIQTQDLEEIQRVFKTY
ncbi:MAG: L-asparaginase, partial [bacterium]|nr:L-asparaginase [bacterium]